MALTGDEEYGMIHDNDIETVDDNCYNISHVSTLDNHNFHQDCKDASRDDRFLHTRRRLYAGHHRPGGDTH